MASFFSLSRRTVVDSPTARAPCFACRTDDSRSLFSTAMIGPPTPMPAPSFGCRTGLSALRLKAYPGELVRIATNSNISSPSNAVDEVVMGARRVVDATTEGNRDMLGGHIVHISRRAVAHIPLLRKDQSRNPADSDVEGSRVRARLRLVAGHMRSRPWVEAADSRKPLEEAYRTRPAPGRNTLVGADCIQVKVLPARPPAPERRLPLLCLFPRSLKQFRRLWPPPSRASESFALNASSFSYACLNAATSPLAFS